MQNQKARTASMAGRKLKNAATGSDSSSDSFSSHNPTSRPPKNRNSKANAPRSPQLLQLQEELRKAKEQLSSSESLKKKAQQEAEEAKKQLAVMSEKLEESHKQLLQLSDSEDARLQELRKISHDRDRAWESELDALQKQHELDSAALGSAMSEIQKLRIQLDRSGGYEAAQEHDEIHRLRLELNNAEMQLEVARMTEETLRGDLLKANETCKSLALELDQSKNQVSSSSEEDDNLKTEINDLKDELSKLRSALEGSERRYQEEYIQSTLQIRSAYELVERTKSESHQLETKLNAAKADAEGLMNKLLESEAKLQKESELQAEVEKSVLVLADLKACLLDKETELQCINEENDLLKLEIQERDRKNKTKDDDFGLTDLGIAGEDKSSTKAGILELEDELRKMKVQCNQWRKAAEAAAAMLSTGNDGKYSLDYHTLGGKLGSPLSDDIEDDSLKKKNGNMLRKIGVLLKKGQK